MCMDYERTYKNIIENRKNNPLRSEVYGEIHHIVPKSLGGSNDDDNLVRLSAREHFICHMLLAEMYPKNTLNWYKMNHAFMRMKANSLKQFRYVNNRYYELKRKDISTTMSFNQKGNKNSQFGKIWIHSMTERKSLKIEKSMLTNYLECGYELGRVINFDLRIVKLKLKNETFLLYNGIKFCRKVIVPTVKQIFNIEIKTINDLRRLDIVLRKLYLDKMLSTTQLAKRYKTSDVTIRKYLMKFGIPLRDQGGKMRL